jgi:hypothetical protein
MNQPIHETLKPEVAPERFELTWEMIEELQRQEMIASENSCKIFNDSKDALGIILQCRTFSPGLFEKKDGVWRRAGETQKHYNAEGC